MASAVRQLRGTAEENDAKAFPSGVLTVDETNHDIRVHDGSTPGGHPLRIAPQDGLLDGHPVVAPTPQSGDLLQFSDGVWVNFTPPTIIDGGNI